MLKRAFACAALAACALPATAAAQTQTAELVPGVTHTRELRWTGAGPLVLHSIIGPRPGGLYALKPVLSNNVLTGRETVTSMQRRLSRSATLAGVNGDLFNFNTGHPSGIYLRNGVLASRPEIGRSSLGIGQDGLLRVGRIGFFGSWQIGGFPAHPLFQFNRPLEDKKLGLFTPSWGQRTPRRRRAVEVVLADVTNPVPNADMTARIVAVRRKSGGPIPRGGAVIQAWGYWRIGLLAEAAPGREITIQLKLRPWWDGVADAIGGGPLLVRDGAPVLDAGEDFSSGQVAGRHPRTAVGQLADGRIVFLAVEGRRSGSIGVPNWELALEMARLGAVTAMALDAGGSTTLAFNGSVLNRPGGGAERPVGNALMLFYYGAFAPEPRFATFSPNGDGVADVQRLAAKVVKKSHLTAQLVQPDGQVVWQFSDVRRRGTMRKLLGGALPEGRWQWIVEAVDLNGRQSRMVREFTVNNTLGFLDLSRERIRVRPRRGGRLVVSWRLAHGADVTVRMKNAAGRVVRRLLAQPGMAPGEYAIVWNGRTSRGQVVRTGTYTVHVQATNELGPVTLERDVRVKRVRLRHKPRR